MVQQEKKRFDGSHFSLLKYYLALFIAFNFSADFFIDAQAQENNDLESLQIESFHNDEVDQISITNFDSREIGEIIASFLPNTASVSIRHYFAGQSLIPSTGFEINGFREFPVASSFKPWVALYYLWYTPQAEWQVGTGSNVFNTIVYSNNSTVGRVIHEVATTRANQGETLQGNDLELFNDFLINSVGLSHGIYSFGFNSPIQGLVDGRVSPVVLDGLGDEDAIVGNIGTTHDSTIATAFLLSLMNQEDQQVTPAGTTQSAAGQTLIHLMSLKSSVYLSPFEREFQTVPSAGKDGVLPEGDINNYGLVFNDSVIFRIADNEYITVNFMSGGANELLVGQVAAAVHQYVESGNFVPTTFPANAIPENIYDSFEVRTGYEAVDQEGIVEVNLPREITDNYSTIVTVNTFDGTVSINDQDNEGNFHSVSQFQSLIGTRLLLNEGTADRLNQNAERFGGDGAFFDGQAGVYFDRTGYRATLTPNLVAEFVGTLSLDGFADIEAATEIALLRALNRDGTISGHNSNYTIHVVPPVLQYYRRQEELQYEGTEVDINPYWSYGCVNLHPRRWEELKAYLNGELALGNRVLVIFAIPGQDQVNMLREGGNYSGVEDLFFENNLITTLNNLD
jgi:hypothetical protein